MKKSIIEPDNTSNNVFPSSSTSIDKVQSTPDIERVNLQLKAITADRDEYKAKCR